MEADPRSSGRDEAFMRLALAQADLAARSDEVPVGAVVVDEQGEVWGRGHNLRETREDPTAHAEIIAIQDAAERRGSWRLDDLILYVTLEPCPMCAGALVCSRISRLVYGSDDPKAGAVRSLYAIPTDRRLNHRLEVTAGVLAAESTARLQRFFAELRRRA